MMGKKSRRRLGRLPAGLFTLLLAAAFVRPAAARGPDRAEPLDCVGAYSLEIGPAGPGAWYFPMGLRPGLTHLTTHAGFNLLQVSSTHTGFRDREEPFPPAAAPTRFGHVYYSLGRAGQTLGQGRGLPRHTATRGLLPAAVDPAGNPWGRRAGINIFDADTRDYLHDYLAAFARRWGADHPPGRPTLFWGMDNEWEGTGFDYGQQGVSAFRDWLRDAYAGDIAGLNESWHTALPGFEAIATVPMPIGPDGKRGPDTPDFRERPGLFLDWMTFRSETFTRLQAAMAQTTHENDPHRRGVISKQSSETIEKPRVNRLYTFDYALFAELVRPASGGLLGANMYGAGDRHAYEVNYLYHCINPGSGRDGYGVMLTENNNHAGPGHQWAATNWRILANGLKAVNFFCAGYPGALRDYDTFGHVEPASGRPKDKMHYAARWAHAIHRAERLWSEAAPAAGLPRLALLLPRRDALLSERTPESNSPWAQPRNRRVILFRRLREQGYWVDVIPYDKLNPDFLAGYQALFLIGAEHLDAAESQAVADYVTGGGRLIADARPGFFDQHHRVRRQLDQLLGLALGDFDPSARATVSSGNDVPLYCRGLVSVTPAGARILRHTDDGRPLVLAHDHGRGRVLYFATELGAIEAAPPVLLPGYAHRYTSPTADAEEYGVYQADTLPGHWLGALLRDDGLLPPVRGQGADGRPEARLRVEQPLTDSRGNVAVVITTRAQREPETVPALEVELPLPGGPWRRGLWAPAEHMDLQPVVLRPLERDGPGHRFRLPGLASAGVLYLLADHPPLPGITITGGTGRAIDGHTVQVAPGESFTVRVTLHDPAGQAAGDGELSLAAFNGWTVSPAAHRTRPGRGGRPAAFTFTVTPDPVHERLHPDWLYPLVARWRAAGRVRALATVNVEAMPDPGRVRRLLSDNRFADQRDWPDDYPWRQHTGATYRYLSPEAALIGEAEEHALTSGRLRRVRFAAARAEILFDLGAAYRIDRIQVRGKTAGTRLRARLGTDRRFWQEGGTFSPVADRWHEDERGASRADFPVRTARFILLEAEFPGDRGEIAEVEIWGYPSAGDKP